MPLWESGPTDALSRMSRHDPCICVLVYRRSAIWRADDRSLRDDWGGVPHAYFDGSERSPFGLVVRYVLFGEGDTALVTHEVLRKAEPEPSRRPVIHVS